MLQLHYILNKILNKNSPLANIKFPPGGEFPPVENLWFRKSRLSFNLNKEFG